MPGTTSTTRRTSDARPGCSCPASARAAVTARVPARRTSRRISSSTWTSRCNVGDDTIEGTADYRGITETVRSIVEERSFDLIESMAAAIAEEILALDRVVRVTAVVHKPNAAGRLGIDGVAAAATAPSG